MYLFEISTNNNIYIYNLVKYFFKYLYLSLTSRTSTKNIIFKFNYYLQANSKSYAI